VWTTLCGHLKIGRRLKFETHGPIENVKKKRPAHLFLLQVPLIRLPSNTHRHAYVRYTRTIRVFPSCRVYRDDGSRKSDIRGSSAVVADYIVLYDSDTTLIHAYGFYCKCLYICIHTRLPRRRNKTAAALLLHSSVQHFVILLGARGRFSGLARF